MIWAEKLAKSYTTAKLVEQGVIGTAQDIGEGGMDDFRIRWDWETPTHLITNRGSLEQMKL